MRTLRIYGDSFGASVDQSMQSWVTILKEKLQIPLVNKAVFGGSTEYAALKFVNDVEKDVIKDNDIVIYIPSTKGRLHFDFQISNHPETAAGYCHGPDTRPNVDNSWYNKGKEHIEWWMVNASHDIISINFESYTHLISNVARSKPNATFIILKHIEWDHHVPNIIHPDNFLMPSVLLRDITENEIIGGYSYMDFVEFTQYDPRSNHLTIPNLKILAELVYETINTQSVKNFTIDKFKNNLIERITSKEQYLEYINQGYLDYSYHILRNLSNL
jgi:hypothetical protein